MMVEAGEVLAFHREITAAPSVSGSEKHLADFLEGTLFDSRAAVKRINNSLLATLGTGPLLLLDTHIDTAPPGRGWTRHPHQVEVIDGRVYGLGATDAKASVVAMTAAFLRYEEARIPVTLALALVEGGECRGIATEQVLEVLNAEGRQPVAAVIGEPTDLNIAVAQKGQLNPGAEGDARPAAGARSKVEVASKRLEPRETALEEIIVEAAVRARPGGAVYGSTALSDLVFMKGIPAVECGPGRPERSHTPDEFVLESEILDGVQFYLDLIHNFIQRLKNP